jgi:hypothetical protein
LPCLTAGRVGNFYTAGDAAARRTPVMLNASGGFVPWTQQPLLFTASSTSEVLNFLSAGTPGGEPPVVLLADVSLDPVPEPASIALFAGGCLALWKTRNRFRRSAPHRR